MPQQPAAGTRRRTRRDPAAIAASLFAHLAIFAAIGLNIPKPAYRTPGLMQPIKIWLIPHAASEPDTPLQHPPSSVAQPGLAAPQMASAPTPTTSVVTQKPPTAASQREIGAAASTEQHSAQPLSAPGAAGTNAGVSNALRTSVGCDVGHALHLTLEEKDRCNQLVGAEAKRGPKFIDPIPAEKRAYYDAVQQAYQAAADPQHPFIRDKDGNIQPWGKGPGVGCGMRFGGPPPPPDHSSLTDKIKATGLIGVNLGPLRCGVVIPQGFMTPEIGIPAP